MATDFGRDLACLDDLDPNAREVEDEELLVQEAYKRITTPRGSVVDDDDYGKDVRSYLQKAMTAAEIASIPGQLRNEILKDDRFDDVKGTVVLEDGGQMLRGELILFTGEGPFPLVFEATADTVARILEGV